MDNYQTAEAPIISRQLETLSRIIDYYFGLRAQYISFFELIKPGIVERGTEPELPVFRFEIQHAPEPNAGFRFSVQSERPWS
jgi:hypothetical protein